jgi:hypothetical protein
MTTKNHVPKKTSPTATRVTGPASYFPSIDKKYGKSIAEVEETDPHALSSQAHGDR